MAGEFNISAEDLRTLQDGDETLSNARAVADGTTTTTGEKFFCRDGLLYRWYTPPPRCQLEQESIEQLVLPITCRRTVL